MKHDAYVRADETPTADGGRIGQYPRFRLKVLPDNVNRPTQVTVCPRRTYGTDPTTEWITAAIEDAVPLEAVA